MWNERRIDFYQKLYDDELARYQEYDSHRNIYFGLIHIFYLVVFYIINNWNEFNSLSLGKIGIRVLILSTISLLILATILWGISSWGRKYRYFPRADVFKREENGFYNHYYEGATYPTGTTDEDIDFTHRLAIEDYIVNTLVDATCINAKNNHKITMWNNAIKILLFLVIMNFLLIGLIFVYSII